MEPTLHPRTWQLLGAGHATVEPRSASSEVCNPYTRIYLVTDGRGELSLDDHNIEMRPGFMYIAPAFCRYNMRCDSTLSFYYLHVQPDDDSDHRPIFDGWKVPDEIKVLPSEAVIFPELLRLNPDGNPSDEYPREPVKIITDALINVLIARWLMDCTPCNHPKHEGIASVIDMLRTNPTIKITTSEMAEKAGMSQGHFGRLFKQETGMSPMVFLRHQHMMQAQMRLTTGNTHIKEIAQELGYDDCNYFTRIFTKDVGMTPTQFRRVSRHGLLPA